MPELTCAACGAPMEAGLKFCGVCGAKAPEPPPPPAPEPEPAIELPLPEPQASAPEPAPLRFWDTLLTLAIFSVPLAGLLVSSMWAFGWALGKKPKKNRRDLALAQFILKAAFLLAFLVFYFVNFSAMNAFFRVMLS